MEPVWSLCVCTGMVGRMRVHLGQGTSWWEDPAEGSCLFQELKAGQCNWSTVREGDLVREADLS